MKIADTISVNPSKTALGHVETPSSSIFRSPVINAEATSRSVDLVKILLPSDNAGVSELKKYAVPLRTIFATILLVTGITLLEASMSVGLAITSLCFGAFLALGLFTRPVMLGAAAYYCICGALSIRYGAPNLSVFSLMFGSLLFAVVGAGKYSCDTLLRSFIIRHRKQNYKKDSEYKVFHNVKF